MKHPLTLPELQLVTHLGLHLNDWHLTLWNLKCNHKEGNNGNEVSSPIEFHSHRPYWTFTRKISIRLAKDLVAYAAASRWLNQHSLCSSQCHMGSPGQSVSLKAGYYLQCYISPLITKDLYTLVVHKTFPDTCGKHIHQFMIHTQIIIKQPIIIIP